MNRVLLFYASLSAAFITSSASPSFAQTGACCFPCDDCILATESECLEQEGEYRGDGTTCIEECPPVAWLPEPALCEVDPADELDGVFFCPSVPAPLAASFLRVKILAGCGAMGGAHVTVTMTSATPFCGGDLTLSGVTNSEGVVTIPLAGGGCRDNIAGSCIIKADGVTIRSYRNVKSPDFDGTSGDGSVGIADLIEFSDEFLDQAPNACHDYDNDENTGLSDLILFSPAFVNANHCP